MPCRLFLIHSSSCTKTLSHPLFLIHSSPFSSTTYHTSLCVYMCVRVGVCACCGICGVGGCVAASGVWRQIRRRRPIWGKTVHRCWRLRAWLISLFSRSLHVHISIQHMYTYIHTYTCAYIYVYFHVCIYTYIHICTYICIHTYIYIYIHIYKHMCINIYIYMSTYSCVCMKECACWRLRASLTSLFPRSSYIHKYVHVHIYLLHTYTCVYICTSIHNICCIYIYNGYRCV